MTGFAVSCARGRSCKCCFLVATGFSSCLRSHVPYFIIFYSEHMIAASDLSRLQPDFVIVVWYNRTNFPKLPKFTIWEFSYYSTILSLIICSASQVDDGRVAEEGGRHGSGRNCLRNGSEDRIVCPLIANVGNLRTGAMIKEFNKTERNRIARRASAADACSNGSAGAVRGGSGRCSFKVPRSKKLDMKFFEKYIIP